MLPQDALHEAPEVGADVLPPRPVDGQVGPYGLDQLTGDVPQGLVAEHLHRAVVGADGVVEANSSPDSPSASPRALALTHLRDKPINSSITCAASTARFW